ncbi:MAG TPA: hypothetical protein VN969_31200 [Streptosporangiaceae bacterium]|nr:hypothetical protein [Streptosporangiaceae bacterium]
MARQQATDGGQHPVVPGKVVAELHFGFWRYLLASKYYTALWVPALSAAFPAGRRLALGPPCVARRPGDPGRPAPSRW